MFISEIFDSIQGEGSFTGVPSTFIRTSGCNLRCKWCDTKYASWFPEGEKLNIEEIIKNTPQNRRHIVITGGEPMISKDLPILCEELKNRGHHITIETAGTIEPNDIACDLVSLSPKLSNSTPSQDEISQDWINKHEELRWNFEIIRQWLAYENFQLKFVVQEEQDINEIEESLEKLEIEIPVNKIFLMPEGIDAQSLEEKEKWITNLCLEKGYRYGQRLHIQLFGNTKGT